MTELVFHACTDGTRLGLGGAPLGNLFAPVPDAQARELLAQVWADGGRCYDTAPHYGHGLSERRIGDALRAQPRQHYTLSSKVGRLLRPDAAAPAEQHSYVQTLPFVQHWDFSAAGVRRSVEDSLQRLGLARLDAVFLHDIDVAGPAAQVLPQVIDEALPTLHQLRREGLVGAVGLGVNDQAVVRQLLAHADLQALLLAGRYSLLDPSALDLLPELGRRQVALALGGVFNSGILAQRLQPGQTPTFNYARAPQPWLDKALHLQAVCDRHQTPLPAAALQFVLAHPQVQMVLLGVRHTHEWQLARAHARQPIPAALWAELVHEGLLPAHAPTPAEAA